MKKDIAVQWVAALRSGQYKQGKGKLRDKHDNYCCLGVLCDILGVEWFKNDIECNYSTSKDSRATKFLPESIVEESGMRTTAGKYDYANDSLVAKNDNSVAFSEIADIIEQNWEKL